MSTSGKRKPTNRKTLSPAWKFTLAGGIFLVLVALFLVRQLSVTWIVAGLIGVNVSTFLLYGFDKLSATRGWLRVPELTLFLFSLVGGSLSALLGQQLFRHKTQKSSFQRIFWLVVIVQVGLLAWAWWTFGR